MASTAAMSAGRSMPAVYSIPLGPRIRPPRLLPGTKADNTNPQPAGDAPEGLVWVQGKWRNPLSNAAKDRRSVQSAQVEKALRNATHGMHIYAYRQIRTNQVVYSLSRVMQNNKILDQLIYHGKQTKPAALRRDVWRPYFSIHFPQTPAGAEAGLDTYRTLRELSTKRQLSPPDGLLVATEEDVEKARARFDPANFQDLKENNRPEVIRLPRIGQILPPAYRAKKLMDQKQSSVADVAFALSLINDATLSPQEKKLRAEKQLTLQHKARSRRNRRRVNEIRRHEEAKEEQIELRKELVNRKSGQLKLDKYSAERVALEHNGVLQGRGEVKTLENLEEVEAATIEATRHLQVVSQTKQKRPQRFDAEAFKKVFTEEWMQRHPDPSSRPPFPQEELEKEIEQKIAQDSTAMKQWRQGMQEVSKQAKPVMEELNEASRHVLVLWSDLKDAMHAQKWSANVQHDWLDAKAIIKKGKSVVRQPAFIDEEGHVIEEQRHTRLFQSSSSSHIIGRDVSEKWFQTPEQLAKIANNARTVQPSNQAQREAVVQSMIACRAAMQPRPATTINTLHTPVSTNSTNLDKKNASDKLAALAANYPAYAQALDKLDRYTNLITRSEELIQQTQVNDLKDPNLEEEQRSIARELIDDCDAEFPGYRDLEQRRLEILNSLQSNDPESKIENLEAELAEIEDDIESSKVDYVLRYHRNQLQEQGDESWVDDTQGNEHSSTTSTAGNQINAHELKDMNIEVEDKRSMWSRVKGVFGGR